MTTNLVAKHPKMHQFLERETGIEPASLAWKARVLPLNYSRLRQRAQRAIGTLPETISLVEEAGFEPA